MKIINITFLIIGVMLGISIAECPNLDYFEISKEISVYDFMSYIITVFLAIFVYRKLDKNTNSENNKRLLFIDKIKDLDENINNLELLIQGSKIPYTSVTNIIHLCKLCNNNLFVNIDKFIGADFNAEKEQINSCLSELRRSLTTTSIDPNKTDKPKVIKGIIVYPNTFIKDALTKSTKLKDSLFELKLKINSK